MPTSSNLVGGGLPNVLDTSFYIYLNPELEHVHNITTVEAAYTFYMENRLPYNASNLVTKPEHVPDRNEFLRDFEHTVYYTMYSSNIMHDDFIADDVRSRIADDVERLAVIHYHRVGRGVYDFRYTSVDSNFNPYMYRVMHGITREMTLPQVYNDYLNRKYVDVEPVVIGNITELTYTIKSNITASIDNLVVNKNLIVKEATTLEKNAIINGHLHVSDTATIEINGGTIAISDNFGNLFEEASRSATSDSLTVGQSTLRYVDANMSGGATPSLVLDHADMVVNSNLFVKENGIYSKSVLIGNNVFYDTTYSMQCDKKIRVEGTDVLSDDRLKRNVEPVDTAECLEDTLKLSVKRFEYAKKNAPPVTGLIAQEAERVVPEAISALKGSVPVRPTVVGTAISVDTLLLVTNYESDIELSGLVEGCTVLLRDVGDDVTTELTIGKIAFPQMTFGSTSRQIAFSTGNIYQVEEVRVDDVRSIDYTQLLCKLIGAVQELAKRQSMH